MKDKSEEIYNLFKQGKDLDYIAKELNICVDEDYLYKGYRIQSKLFNYISEDSWLFNNPFKMFEFTSMFLSMFGYQLGLYVLMKRYIEKYKRQVIEYKEEYYNCIQNVINYFTISFSDWKLIDFLVMLQNYINEDKILDLYIQNKFNNVQLRIILRYRDKKHLFNQFLFMKRIFRKEQ